MSITNIAVTGIAGSFPNSNNVAEYYDNLKQKKMCLNPVDDYWKIINPTTAPLFGKYAHHSKFDAGFFGIHHKQAEEMHQSCRKLLELSVEAVIDAGINPVDLKGSNTGVFVAVTELENSNEWMWNKQLPPSFGTFGSMRSALAQQISYNLQLNGPAVSIDSHCCSSLYALDQAITAIKSGRCDSALVCGVNVIQNPQVHFQFHLFGLMNVGYDGNVFNDKSNGYIRAEAAVVVLIQKIENATRVYAEILNIRTNHDRFKNMGISHPSSKMMTQLCQETYTEIGIDPSPVTFVECHATGTAVGLTEEIDSLEQVFCSKRKSPLLIGSVKANIGHTEPVSGLCSLIKVLVGLQHDCILPNPVCQPIKFKSGQIEVVTDPISLPINLDIVIGCNNLGFGGTNGHLVLKHKHQMNYSKQRTSYARLVCYSARTKSSLTKFSNSLKGSTEEYLNVVQNIFRRNIPNYYYRGYTVIRSGTLIENGNNYCSSKAHLCFVYPPGSLDWLSLFEATRKIPIFSKTYKSCPSDNNGFKSLSIGVIVGAFINDTLSLKNALQLVLKLKNRITTTNIELEAFKEMVEQMSNINIATVSKVPVTRNIVKVIIGPDDDNNNFSIGPQTFLTTLGRLYVLGFDLHTSIMYPPLKNPVKAPCISPLIQWQHGEDWHVLQYQLRNAHRVITIDENNWKILKGHVIDDFNLVPATDVASARGRINFSFWEDYRTNLESVGVEFAGMLSNGQRVMGLSSKSTFSNLISLQKGILCHVPDKWTFEEAATVSATYLTLMYALLKVSRLQRGQSILIHSGTGGIGQSAINIALHYECNVFVTVGSVEKRNYLKTIYPSIQESHIGNSGDTTFEQMVLKETKGKGVDIVLNSFSELKLHASLLCLARRGTFLDLGKYDALLNNFLSLDKFANGCMYAGIHLDTFFDADPTTKQQLISLLQNGINKGYVKPLPRVVFDKYNVESALRYMSTGKHTGKILIKYKDELTIDVPLKAKPRFYCDSNKMYILIGGLGGLGLELADWLIGRGAQKLILVSRRGVTNGYQKYRLHNWKRLGCKVLVEEQDLTSKEGCFDLLTKAKTIGQVDGIFNCAVDLRDALIENQTEENFKVVFATKVIVTNNMDMLSRKLCPSLRQFVVCSSIVTSMGNSSQTNYGMANSIMERICELRKEDGFPALAIQWGLINDIGLAFDNPSIMNEFLDRLKVSSCLNLMDTFLTQDEVVVSCAVYNKKTRETSKSQDFLNTITNVLAITNIKQISVHSKLSTLGLDSITTVQLRQLLGSKYGLYFKPRELQNMTLHKLMENYNKIENNK